VTEHQKPPPGFSAFKAFLEKLAKVPKSEIDDKEAEYKKQRPQTVGKRRKPA
jgi:hypothetical protein